MNERKVLVHIKNLSVSYGDKVALENVDLNIYRDDFLGVIGPNGGGKTTLVKAIIRAIPYSGEITLSSELKENGSKIGYLPQINNFDKKFPISVLDVILSGLQGERILKHRYTIKNRERAVELMELFGIESIGARPIGELSGGQTQRALLCRAIISEPKLLILDEPANFVDSKFERELYDILKQLNDKMAIVMVSHDLGMITSVIKDIVCVNKEVHRHSSNKITPKQLEVYNCPIQLVTHGDIPHIVLENH